MFDLLRRLRITKLYLSVSLLACAAAAAGCLEQRGLLLALGEANQVDCRQTCTNRYNTGECFREQLGWLTGVAPDLEPAASAAGAALFCDQERTTCLGGCR